MHTHRTMWPIGRSDSPLIGQNIVLCVPALRLLHIDTHVPWCYKYRIVDCAMQYCNLCQAARLTFLPRVAEP